MGILSKIFGKKSPAANYLVPNYLELSNTCSIDNDRLIELKILCESIYKNKSRYEKVASLLGQDVSVWVVIAAIHYREADNSFKTCLHNGDPLPGPTKNVPKGRGPFNSWEEAALDALKLDGFNNNSDWTLPGCFSFCERYNGIGYRKYGVLSPYVWAGTNHYTGGLFVRDGVMNTTKKDKRFGVAPLIITLKGMDK